VTFWPAVALAGPFFVTERSTLETVRKEEDWLLSGLLSIMLVTAAVLKNVVPLTAPEGMCPMSVKFANAPLASEARVHVTVPPAPTEGLLEQSKAGPLFWVMETNVIVPGSVSVSETDCAVDGPLFATVMS